jgi:hypothetical protein
MVLTKMVTVDSAAIGNHSTAVPDGVQWRVKHMVLVAATTALESQRENIWIELPLNRCKGGVPTQQCVMNQYGPTNRAVAPDLQDQWYITWQGDIVIPPGGEVGYSTFTNNGRLLTVIYEEEPYEDAAGVKARKGKRPGVVGR